MSLTAPHPLRVTPGKGGFLTVPDLKVKSESQGIVGIVGIVGCVDRIAPDRSTGVEPTVFLSETPKENRVSGLQ